MKFLNELQANKKIVSVEVYDLADKLDFIADPTKKAEIQKKLVLIETYRFFYKVGTLKVVGYVAIPKTGTALPCLIHLRGGSRDFSMLQPRSIYGQLVAYALEGYVVISTQYPGVEGGDGVDQFGSTTDVASAIKLKDVLAGLSNADVSRLGVKGHSRGGLMAYLLLKEVSWLKAAVIAAAPTDQVRQGKERPDWREHQVSLWGKSKEEMIKRSPLRFVAELPKKVPVLLMHGSADWRVSPQDSMDMSKAMFKHSIPHRFILFEGADHGIEYKAEYFRQTLEWFNRFLKGTESLPNLKPHGE